MKKTKSAGSMPKAADVLVPKHEYVLCLDRVDHARVGISVCKAKCKRYGKCASTKHKGGDTDGS